MSGRLHTLVTLAALVAATVVQVSGVDAESVEGYGAWVNQTCQLYDQSIETILFHGDCNDASGDRGLYRLPVRPRLHRQLGRAGVPVRPAPPVRGRTGDDLPRRRHPGPDRRTARLLFLPAPEPCAAVSARRRRHRVQRRGVPEPVVPGLRERPADAAGHGIQAERFRGICLYGTSRTLNCSPRPRARTSLALVVAPPAYPCVHHARYNHAGGCFPVSFPPSHPSLSSF